MKRTLIVPESLESAAALEATFPEGAVIQAGPRRTDEFLEGAKWVLERDAETGRRVWQDPPIYALAMEGGAKQPRLTLFYTIAYDKVLLLSLSAGNALNRAIPPPGPALA
jgi:hypothetical protein